VKTQTKKKQKRKISQNQASFSKKKNALQYLIQEIKNTNISKQDIKVRLISVTGFNWVIESDNSNKGINYGEQENMNIERSHHQSPHVCDHDDREEVKMRRNDS
jgi:hypothetical protein